MWKMRCKESRLWTICRGILVRLAGTCVNWSRGFTASACSGVNSLVQVVVNMKNLSHIENTCKVDFKTSNAVLPSGWSVLKA